MPKIKVNDITMNYEQQGTGEPLVLIPYLAADNACYAFQVADYAKHFTCISLDPRGAGETDKPAGTYSTQLFADDVAAFMQARGIERAHISGLSLGAATGMWLAARHPEKVKSLSLHSAWTKSDPFLKTVVQGWQSLAKGLGSVTDMVIQGIFPWCFTPELYAAKPDYIDSLAAFVRSRPAQPLEAFLRQSDAVIAHDAAAALAGDQGADPDHLRPPRHGHLHPLRRRDEERHRPQRDDRLRGLRPCADLRERRRVQRQDAGFSEAQRRIGGLRSERRNRGVRVRRRRWAFVRSPPARGQSPPLAAIGWGTRTRSLKPDPRPQPQGASRRGSQKNASCHSTAPHGTGL